MMTGASNVVVELTAIEASKFVEYQRHRQLFLTLLEAGVFETKNGTATLSFNHEGMLMEVWTQKELAFKRRAGMV